MSQEAATKSKPATGNKVTITYNGITKSFPRDVNETVGTLLAAAIAAFQIVQNQHLMGLFDEAGNELTDAETLKDAKVKNKAELILRQSAVRGGQSAAFEVGEGLLEETFAHLRDCGRGRKECVAYWTGPVDEPEVVDRVVHPRHEGSPGGYEIDPQWLNEFWRQLARDGSAIRVQIHTHGGIAYHSATDDGFAIIQTAGFRSLVIPDFAMGPVGLDGTYLAELSADGSWSTVEPTSALRLRAE